MTLKYGDECRVTRSVIVGIERLTAFAHCQLESTHTLNITRLVIISIYSPGNRFYQTAIAVPGP
jgi:hypothetical protein